MKYHIKTLYMISIGCGIHVEKGQLKQRYIVLLCCGRSGPVEALCIALGYRWLVLCGHHRASATVTDVGNALWCMKATIATTKLRDLG